MQFSDSTIVNTFKMVLIDDKRNFFLVASLDIFFKNSLDEFPEINMERVQNSEAPIRRR